MSKQQNAFRHIQWKDLQGQCYPEKKMRLKKNGQAELRNCPKMKKQNTESFIFQYNVQYMDAEFTLMS